MRPKETILWHLKQHGESSAQELVQLLGISRQAVHVHLQSLIEKGVIDKLGSTRGATYCLQNAKARAAVISRSYRLTQVEEDQVYMALVRSLKLRTQLSSSVEKIVGYAFTEMLNNAIDHSKAKTCQVRFALEPYWVEFQIRDKGVGIFDSIASKFHLRDENEAVGELIKGKTTTMAERHSGEGIFFTSKAADSLCLRSHRLALEFDTFADDIFVHQKRFIRGTQVRFRIRRNSRKKLAHIFEAYSPEEFDFRFERTKVHVNLFTQPYVSRSQAKRLVNNLDRFQEVIFDFKNVRSIGQGFADEVFRVFAKHHPAIKLTWINAHPSVQTMIRHAMDDKD